MTFVDGLIIASVIWVFITTVVALFSYFNGWFHFDDRLDWSNGFETGWNECEKVCKQMQEKNSEGMTEAAELDVD